MQLIFICLLSPLDLTDRCITDRCITDVFITDQCITDVCITDQCITDVCITDDLHLLCEYFNMMFENKKLCCGTVISF